MVYSRPMYIGTDHGHNPLQFYFFDQTQNTFSLSIYMFYNIPLYASEVIISWRMLLHFQSSLWMTDEKRAGIRVEHFITYSVSPLMSDIHLRMSFQRKRERKTERETFQYKPCTNHNELLWGQTNMTIATPKHCVAKILFKTHIFIYTSRAEAQCLLSF